MGFELQSFRTQVARRIFLLFIVCAILPITALAALSYFQVARHLKTLHFQRLNQESKAIATSIYERLLFLKSEMAMIAVSAEGPGAGREALFQRMVAQMPGGRFETIQLRHGPFGDTTETNDFRLDINATGKKAPGLVMSMGFAGGDARLVGSINQAYLWTADSRLAAGSQVCILGRNRTVLHCPERGFIKPVLSHLDREQWPHKGTLDWQAGNHTYRAGYSGIFLEATFKTDGWIVVVVESTANSSTLAKDFAFMFPALIVFSLGLVFMLGQYLIRRSMGPIETLQDATGRIAEGEFGYEVKIDSGDEFEKLGQAFNEMSRRLKEGQLLLIRTARMGTMGQMASGFVHEVRQPLSAIMGIVQLVMLKEENQENVQSLETVVSAVEDLDTIISRFRSFGQDTPIEKATLNLNDVVQGVYRLLSVRFKKWGIECRLELEDRFVTVWGDFRSLQQVLSNLMINVLDELAEKEEGQPLLIIRTHSDDEHATLTVADNGRGISEDIREKVFDPFFTTKPSDKGTGLGMAIVESIVHQHGASLQLDSTVGKGTTISIDFACTSEGGENEK